MIGERGAYAFVGSEDHPEHQELLGPGGDDVEIIHIHDLHLQKRHKISMRWTWVRQCMAWMNHVDECRTACMICCFDMSLPQFCASKCSSHCDETPRLDHSSLGPGRELFGVAVWILENLNGRRWMFWHALFGDYCVGRVGDPSVGGGRSKLLPQFWALRVRCMRHVVHDDTRTRLYVSSHHRSVPSGHSWLTKRRSCPK